MFQNITPITKNIIILNVIIFILAFIFPQLNTYLAAYYPTSPNFKSWQIITHMFMHGGFMHIAFNMLTLASFGPLLERFLGEKKYILLYFLSGLGAYALNSLWIYYEMLNNGNEFMNVAMLGASGAIFGVVAAFTALYPNAEMMIMFIPFPIKAKILLPIVIVGSIYLGINNVGGVAHFAHIGGAIVGYILIKIWGRNRYRIN